MNNVLEYLRKTIRDVDSSLDVSLSSPLSDLLLSPTASMLSPILGQLGFLMKNLSLSDVENMSEDELDAIASNFLVYRNPGNFARGNVRIYFAAPTDLTIPAGTEFTTRTGLVFVTEFPYSIARAGMAADVSEFPLYFSGDIPVIAQNVGSVYSIQPGEIVTANIQQTYVKVKNIEAFSGGLDKETNDQLFTRLQAATTNLSIASPDSIRKNLTSAFSTIQNIDVIDGSSDLMLRDLIYSGLSSFDAFHKVDFYGKVSGLNEDPYPASMAFTTFASGITVGLLPDISDFKIELNTDQYSKLYIRDDLNVLQTDSQAILDEPFTGLSFSPTWVLSDSILGVGKIYEGRTTEIALDTNKNAARLGSDASVTRADGQSLVRYTYEAMIATNDMFLIYANAYDLYGPGDPRTQEAYHNYAVAWTAARNSHDDLSASTGIPILHTSIPVSNNIIVSGQFSTDDATAYGQMSYVTILRNGSVAMPQDGYGFAWRKGDGSLFNVYIVDNNTLSQDTFIWHDWIMTNQGADSYLAAAKLPIVADNRKYNYRMAIYQNYAMDLWIWQDGTAFVPSEANRILFQGSYTPRALQNELITTDSHTHFGMSVINTEQSHWYYYGVRIDAIDRGHPSVLFKMKAPSAQFPTGKLTTFRYYGFADDALQHGVNAYIYNNTSNEWEFIGSNNANSSTPILQTGISGIFTMGPDYRDNSDDFVNCMAITKTNLVGPVLNTYYVDLENTLPSGIHVGGHADIYVNAPSQMTLTTTSVNLTSSTSFSLTADNGFKLPIQEIVTVSDAGVELPRTSGWTMTNENKGTTWSNQEQFIMHVGASTPTVVDVSYRYYKEIDIVQTHIDNDGNRFVGNDNLIKIMPPVIITFNTLEYRDGPTIAQARLLIKNFINGLTDTFEISDLLALLTANGASYINLDSMNITVREYDEFKNLIVEDEITNKYVLDNVRAFYTDDLEMPGLIKL